MTARYTMSVVTSIFGRHSTFATMPYAVMCCTNSDISRRPIVPLKFPNWIGVPVTTSNNLVIYFSSLIIWWCGNLYPSLSGIYVATNFQANENRCIFIKVVQCHRLLLKHICVLKLSPWFNQWCLACTVMKLLLDIMLTYFQLNHW